MKIYDYKGHAYTVNELSEISGIEPHTIRDRIRRGYSIEEAIKESPIHESVREFCESSSYYDWLGMSTLYLHKIYWKWSVSHGYTPIQIQGFTRQVMKLYPHLKTVPTLKHGIHSRIIRER